MSSHEPHRCVSCHRIVKIGRKVNVKCTTGGKTYQVVQYYCPGMGNLMTGMYVQCVSSWAFE